MTEVDDYYNESTFLSYDAVEFHHGSDIHTYGAGPKKPKRVNRTAPKNRNPAPNRDEGDWGDESVLTN